MPADKVALYLGWIETGSATLLITGEGFQILSKSGKSLARIDKVPKQTLDEIKAANTKIKNAGRGNASKFPNHLSLEKKQLIDKLLTNGTKITPKNVIDIRRLPNGRIVWLEKGNDTEGLKHIIKKHTKEFAKKNIPESKISDVIFTALEKGKIVGYQGKGITRPIYKFNYNEQTYQLAITVGDNGFIISANFKGRYFDEF